MNSLDAAQLVDELESVLDQFQQQWSPEGTDLIERYLPIEQPLRFAALTSFVIVDLELSSRAGKAVAPSDYLEAFPELCLCRPVVRDLFSRAFKLQTEWNPHLRWKDYLATEVPKEWHDELRLPLRYRKTDNLLGKGGQGEVWESIDLELGRQVALKVYAPGQKNSVSLSRFFAEARITSELEHPAIVPVYGVEETDEGRMAYAMRLLRWETLAKRIDTEHQAAKKAGRDWLAAKTVRMLLSHFFAACDAISFANSRGYLHLDLKPDNILIGEYGETMVMDWGLTAQPSASRKDAEESASQKTPPPQSAEALNHNVSTRNFSLRDYSTVWPPSEERPGDSLKYHTGEVAGTLGYMSPEQASGDVSAYSDATDVYGLGAVLYHILVNGAPHGTPRTESLGRTDDLRKPMDLQRLLSRIKLGAFPRPRSLCPAIPKPLEAICLKAMARDPVDRYPTADRLIDDLQNWLADEPVGAYSESRTERFWRWTRGHYKQVTSAGLLLIGLAVVGLIAWTVIRHQVTKARVTATVSAIVSAEPDRVGDIVEQLNRQPLATRELHRRLVEEEAAKQVDRRAVRRLKLVLLPNDRRHTDTVLMGASRIKSVEEFEMLRGIVSRQGISIPRSVTEKWWMFLGGRNVGEAARIRSAVLLATFDADSERWREQGSSVANQLIRRLSNDRVVLQRGLFPVKQHLIPSLKGIFTDESRPLTTRLAAAEVLSEYLKDCPDELAALLRQAAPEQHPILFEALNTDPGRAVEALLSETRRVTSTAATKPAESVTQMRQLARLQSGLLRFGPRNFDWELLQESEDPTIRTELIHLIPLCQIPYRTLVDGYKDLPPASARAAALQCLAEYPTTELPETARRRVAQALKLKEVAQSEGDPGLRSSAAWLLDRWKIEHQEDGESDRIGIVPSGLDWFVSKQNQHVMVTIPRETQGSDFLIGMRNPPLDSDIAANGERVQRGRIGREFAIATCETTIRQFEAFLADYHRGNPHLPYPVDEWIDGEKRAIFGLTPQTPAVYMNWLQAVAYCNWLSRKEGLDPVYPLAVERRAFIPSFPGAERAELPELPPSNLRRSGYRLPTEAEWEFACRANTESPWHFGCDPQQLQNYAHFRSAAGVAPMPVALLKPNGFGLFDMHGNAMEWCHTAMAFSTEDESEGWDDERGRTDQIGVRGGSRQNLPAFVRSEYRLSQSPFVSAIDLGFRIARTITPTP